MPAISNRCPLFEVEYDCLGKRKRKLFANGHKGRAFYAAKLKQGRDPKVCEPDGSKTLAATPTKKNNRKPTAKKHSANIPTQKTTRSQRKMPATKIPRKQMSVLKFLKARNATSATKAIDRKQVWQECDCGWRPIDSLKKAGLLLRADHENGAKEYCLTKEGAAVAMR